jgi:hypothetical protein
MLRAIIIGLLVFFTSIQVRAETDISDRGEPTQRGLSELQIKEILASDLISQFARPETLLAFSPTELTLLAAKVKQSHRELVTERGDGTKLYDLVLQPGHYPRTVGVTGGQGKYVSEQEIAARVVDQLSIESKKRGLSVAVIPADDFSKPLQAKIFLALHTDASNFPCSVGPSLGYSSDGDAVGMHGIAVALALTLGIDPEKFMRDNYTANLRGYYAFKSLITKQFKGLLEMSELTCPAQEDILLSRADLLAKNLAIAIVFALRPSQR